jgi:hypothetical protein
VGGDAAKPQSRRTLRKIVAYNWWLGPVLLAITAWLWQCRFKSTMTESHFDCQYYLAESSIPNAGYGIFVGSKPVNLHEPVLFPEIAIPLLISKGENEKSLQTLINYYLWDSRVIGAHFESSLAVLPGIGMLANGHPESFNVVPDRPRIHVPLHQSPLVGSFSPFHGLNHYPTHNLSPGTEILVNYGTGWKNKISSLPLKNIPKRTLEDLQANGYCLDNLQPGDSHSIKNGSRGAFATRYLPRETVVAPVPVFTILRDALSWSSPHVQSQQFFEDNPKQLLLNYCYGHANSSILLFPASPVVNFINHSSRPNVALRWKTEIFDYDTVVSRQPPGMMLELVALRDINQNEEVLLDYGQAWELAWKRQVNMWQTTQSHHEHSIPPHLSSVNPNPDFFRTINEKPSQPSKWHTACYIPPRDMLPETVGNDGTQSPLVFPHNFRQLHPSQLELCDILERHQYENNKGVQEYQYSVRVLIGHRDQDDRTIFMHHVPSFAITFVDLHPDHRGIGGFRHELRPAGIFPESWLDLSPYP